ncbi:MAG: carbohydrate ABC transporter permease [bacterium]
MFLKGKRVAKYSYVLPVIVVLVGITIFPLIYSLGLSFHFCDLRRGGRWIFAGLDNYGEALFGDARVWSSLKNTFNIGVPAISLEFGIGLGLALLLNRKIVGKRIITSLLITPIMISPIVAGLIWRMLYHEKYGAINGIIQSLGINIQPVWLADPKLAVLAVIFTDVWEWTPLVMMILLAGLQSIPLEPYESARMDGASPFQIFGYITLPLLRLPIMAAIVIRFIDTIKLFDIVYVLTMGGPAGKTETISFYTYLVGFRYFRMGYAAALSYLLLILTIILTTAFIRLMRLREAA